MQARYIKIGVSHEFEADRFLRNVGQLSPWKRGTAKIMINEANKDMCCRSRFSHHTAHGPLRLMLPTNFLSFCFPVFLAYIVFRPDITDLVDWTL